MHWIDYIIVLVSILAAIGTGVWFAHRQKDTSQYFAGGGKIPAWAVGISIFATLISSVTFLAYPGAAYADNWILLVQGLMVPIVLLALVGVIVPLFRKVIRLSTYEYFERRFGLFARLYSSFAFTLGQSLTALKVMMQTKGLCEPWMLMPLTRLTEEEEKAIRDALD